MEKHDIIIQKNVVVTAIGKKRQGNAKPVICIETGDIYASTMDAGDAIGAHFSGISNACRGKQQTVKGLHFCYVKELTNNIGTLTMVLQAKNGNVIAESEEKKRKRKEEQERKEAKLARKAEEKRKANVAKLAKLDAKITKTRSEMDGLNTRFVKKQEKLAKYQSMRSKLVLAV